MDTDEIPEFFLLLKNHTFIAAVKILFLSFTGEDIDVAMVTNMISQWQESFLLRCAASSFEISPRGHVISSVYYLCMIGLYIKGSNLQLAMWLIAILIEGDGWCVPVCLSSHMNKLSQDVNWHKACLLGAHVSHLVSNTMTDWLKDRLAGCLTDS